jgi:glycosyltransferase involved in cell wall biosynthesis
MLKDKIICFALLARNCRNELEQNLLRIERIIPYFKETFIIVVENDSTDGTKELLQSWQEKSNNFLVITNNIESNSNSFINKGASMERISRMTFCRNQYLNFLKDNLKEKVNYLMVFDSRIDSFSAEGIIKALENAPDDWSALFANGRYYFDLFGIKFLGRYYDLFAYVPYGENTDLTYREMALSADLLSNKK